VDEKFVHEHLDDKILQDIIPLYDA